MSSDLILFGQSCFDRLGSPEISEIGSPTFKDFSLSHSDWQHVPEANDLLRNAHVTVEHGPVCVRIRNVEDAEAVATWALGSDEFRLVLEGAVAGRSSARSHPLGLRLVGALVLDEGNQDAPTADEITRFKTWSLEANERTCASGETLANSVTGAVNRLCDGVSSTFAVYASMEQPLLVDFLPTWCLEAFDLTLESATWEVSTAPQDQWPRSVWAQMIAQATAETPEAITWAVPKRPGAAVLTLVGRCKQNAWENALRVTTSVIKWAPRNDVALVRNAQRDMFTASAFLRNGDPLDYTFWSVAWLPFLGFNRRLRAQLIHDVLASPGIEVVELGGTHGITSGFVAALLRIPHVRLVSIIGSVRRKQIVAHLRDDPYAKKLIHVRFMDHFALPDPAYNAHRRYYEHHFVAQGVWGVARVD